MATQALSLPVNITWQRIGYSRDLVDTDFGNQSLPPKWRSSMAVYAYAVPPEQTAEMYPDSRIIYLRLSCSITGWNPSEELDRARQEAEANDAMDDLQRSAWEAILAQDWAQTYWPCSGAIAQIAVYPHQDDGAVGPDDYPFIMDFEPKKRELYETRSESGEYMSGSTNGINIQKGTTEVSTTEKAKILTGASASFSGFGVEGSASVSGEWGTRKTDSDEEIDITNTDKSRERRESTSFTTTINQMYQFFNGYHLGTNRALFAIAPRPHTVSNPAQVDFNLIRGERKLEGLQDMFMVVHVPAHLTGFRIQATLDTGHTVIGSNGNPLHTTCTRNNQQGVIFRRINDDSLPPHESNDLADTLEWWREPIKTDQDEEIDRVEINYRMLLVTRRVIRSGAEFVDGNRLHPTDIERFPDITLDESLIADEVCLKYGQPERTLAKMATSRVEQRCLVADQRNQYQYRVTDAMLGGYSASRYQQRQFVETTLFQGLVQDALQRSGFGDIPLDDFVAQVPDLDLDLQELRTNNNVATVGEVFDEALENDLQVDSQMLAQIQNTITQHVLKPVMTVR